MAASEHGLLLNGHRLGHRMVLRHELRLLLVLKEGRRLEDATQAVKRVVTGLLYTKRCEQGLRDLIYHLKCTLLRKLHQAVLDYIIDEPVDILSDLFIIMELLDRLLYQS